jgi:hypothetical protein
MFCVLRAKIPVYYITAIDKITESDGHNII